MATRIGLCGDVMIGRLVNEHLRTCPPEYLWGDVLPLLQGTDLNLINLEAALTKSEKEIPKVFNFKSDPSHVECLTLASIDVVNLANNHVLDYSEEGLLETLETLDRAGIQHVGAGRNEVEASQPVAINRIGIFGYTDNEPTWKAQSKTPGTSYIEVGDIDAVKHDIASLRDQVDTIIVSIHWGPNMRESPPRSFINFAHAMIEAGVDIIHGHSAHIFQGVEFYRDGLILYDTGDFVDDYYVDPELRNDRSFFFEVEIEHGKVSKLIMTPVLISNFQVNVAKGENAQIICSRMRNLSSEFKTNLKMEEGILRGDA